MKRFEGQAFEGVISNVASFGLFVELENTVEGLIRIGDLKDDYYVYDESRYTLTGERTKKTYGIGDVVRVILARANTEARQIDFVPEGQQKPPKQTQNTDASMVRGAPGNPPKRRSTNASKRRSRHKPSNHS
jgi:DNA-directed RNA polymerase subunit E'/Rpb7